MTTLREPAIEANPQQRLDFVLACVAAAAAAGGVILFFLLTDSRAVDDDELQHLHFAWCLTQGLAPYRDFWDNHPPLLHQLLSFLISRQGEPSGVLLSGRRLCAVLALPGVAGVYLLGRACAGRGAGVAAAAWLACSEVYLLKAVEIRPDGILLTCIAFSAWLILSAMRGASSSGEEGSSGTNSKQGRCGSAWRWVAAGLILGIGATATTKALIPLAAILAAVSVGFRARGRRSGVSRGGVAWFAAAFCTPVGVWLVGEALRGDAGAAWRMTVMENVAYPQRFNPGSLIHATNPYPLLAAAGVGTWAAFRRRGDGAERSQALRAAAIGAGVSAAAIAAMPAAYLQSILLPLPFFCVLSGAGVASLVGWAARRSTENGRWAAGIGLIGVFAAGAAVAPVQRVAATIPRQREQLAGAMHTLDAVCVLVDRDATVFDGRCQAVFRKHAYFYPSLVQGVLMRYREGRLGAPVREVFESTAPTMILKDSRSAAIGDEDWAWIAANYVALAEPYAWVYLPGWDFGATDSSDAVEFVTRFPVRVAGCYLVERSDPAVRVTIDGQGIGDEVELLPGSSVIRLEGRGARVRVRYCPPPSGEIGGGGLP
ncbi:MAG: hypothetical protein BroJett003_03700 [Planctomycetota bacterium]|nr:MAG: hypothetical protein BroJett003_03700 [Planctomycetota bacterium]